MPGTSLGAEFKLLAGLLDFGIAGRARQTLGEEFCDITRVSVAAAGGQGAPSAAQHRLLLLLHVVAPYFLERCARGWEPLLGAVKGAVLRLRRAAGGSCSSSSSDASPRFVGGRFLTPLMHSQVEVIHTRQRERWRQGQSGNGSSGSGNYNGDGNDDGDGDALSHADDESRMHPVSIGGAVKKEKSNPNPEFPCSRHRRSLCSLR